MRLKKPKPLDLNLKTGENPWFQIQFYGRFLAAGLAGVYDQGSEDVLDLITLMDTKRRSYGYRPDYDRAVKSTARLAKDLRWIPHTDQVEHLVRQFWVAVHKARTQLA